MTGNTGYYTDDKEKCLDNIRFAGKEKFPIKILVWIALYERGISEPLFRLSASVAISSDVYIKECFKTTTHFIHRKTSLELKLYFLVRLSETP